MSEENNGVIGQIKINFREKGKPEVVITGDIKAKRIPMLSRSIQVAYRQHKLAITRGKKKIDITDTGNKQEGYQEAQPDETATGNIFDQGDADKKPESVGQEQLVVEDDLKDAPEGKPEGDKKEDAPEGDKKEAPAGSVTPGVALVTK